MTRERDMSTERDDDRTPAWGPILPEPEDRGRCAFCQSLHHHELDCPHAPHQPGSMTRRQA